MSETKHEPTPWQIVGKYKGDNGSFYLSTMHPMPIFELQPIVGSEDLHIANAAFIVRAVNSHDELLAFVKAHAKRDPVFAKGHEKQVIAEARALVARAEGRSNG